MFYQRLSHTFRQRHQYLGRVLMNVLCLFSIILTLTTLKYLCINHENQRALFQFEIIITILVSFFRLI